MYMKFQRMKISGLGIQCPAIMKMLSYIWCCISMYCIHSGWWVPFSYIVHVSNTFFQHVINSCHVHVHINIV